MSDGGPQFRTEFNTFCNQHAIEHEISSPYNAQSNGLAEAAVKNMKHLLIKLDSFPVFLKALIHWRNVPRSADDISPAELFFGRRLRTSLPTLEDPIPPAVNPTASDAALPPLKIGDKVRIQNQKNKRWDKKATVIGQRPTHRSFTVMDDETSRIYLRNRKFLRLRTSVRAPDDSLADSAAKPSNSSSISPPNSTSKSDNMQGHSRMSTRSMSKEREREEEKKRDVRFSSRVDTHTYN
jgi:hypothetical protein